MYIGTQPVLFGKLHSVMGMTGLNSMLSPFPALNASLAPQYENDMIKECICKIVDPDDSADGQ